MRHATSGLGYRQRRTLQSAYDRRTYVLALGASGPIVLYFKNRERSSPRRHVCVDPEIVRSLVARGLLARVDGARIRRRTEYALTPIAIQWAKARSKKRRDEEVKIG